MSEYSTILETSRLGVAAMRHAAVGDIDAVNRLFIGVEFETAFTTVLITGLRFADLMADVSGYETVDFLDRMLHAMAAEEAGEA